MTNEERRNRAAQILESFGSEHQSDEENITDLVTDLMHLAAEEGIDPDKLASRCAMHVDAERIDEITEDEEWEDAGACPQCGGPAIPLGTLGDIMHFRCRNCGVNSCTA